MNLGFSEMLFLFFLALIIFGPKRLPEISRQIGKALAEFRRASNEFKSQLESELRQVELEQALQKQQAVNPSGNRSTGSIAAERVAQAAAQLQNPNRDTPSAATPEQEMTHPASQTNA